MKEPSLGEQAEIQRVLRVFPGPGNAEVFRDLTKAWSLDHFDYAIDRAAQDPHPSNRATVAALLKTLRDEKSREELAFRLQDRQFEQMKSQAPKAKSVVAMTTRADAIAALKIQKERGEIMLGQLPVQETGLDVWTNAGVDLIGQIYGATDHPNINTFVGDTPNPIDSRTEGEESAIWEKLLKRRIRVLESLLENMPTPFMTYAVTEPQASLAVWDLMHRKVSTSARKKFEDKTHFLPFNRGSHPGQIICGAGNPQHPSGYRTGYFWEEVLQFESFLDILGHFIFLEKKEEKVDDGRGGHRVVTKETMIFPRYHQLDSVRKLVVTARNEGLGRNYLIQHSAGSGKTNSISWLSHRLASLHDAKDAKVFDCVVVITDRQVLDRQLQDAIYQIEHAQGVVKAIDQDSKQLAAALIDGTKIVITTLQKFPFVMRGLLHAAGANNQEEATAEQRAEAAKWEAEIAKRRYAVIVDEAHSSQSGETARELKAILGVTANAASEEEEPDWEDRLNQIIQSRGRQPNLSFFAFTATPKGKTLELFGRKGPSGLPEAFHLYSMRQAIEEGFILDVVRNYTTYTNYYRLVKAIEDDPNLPKKKAARALAKFMSLHPHNIEQKTEVMLEHFRQKVRGHLDGRAKAMVVTSSRLHAVRYMQAFERYIAENKITDVRPLVAFSGTVKDPETGLEYTEPGMNKDCVNGSSISERQLPERFATPDYQVLLVANKYQTGFDQPLLCAMYVDKRLDGVQAVQTLSRLNRKIPGKESPFVLDFVNEAENIYKAFKPYFDATSLQEGSDPQQLEELKHVLDAAQVYFWKEVEGFAQVFYKPVAKQRAQDHAGMQAQLQPAVDRFKAMTDEVKRSDFREKLNGYVNIYSFMSQIMPYGDPALEMLYSYGRFLLPHLPLDRDTERVKLGDEVGLQYYRLARVYSGALDLAVGEPEGVKSPTDVGTGRAKDEKVPLSEIIKVLNDRFGTNFSDEDRFFFEQIREKATADVQVVQLRRANPFDKFQLGLRQLIEAMMIQRMTDNDKIVTRYMDDKEFGEAAFTVLSKAIYESIPAQPHESDN